MKHYKLVKFLSNLNVKPPLHERKAPRTNVKPPYWRLPGDGSGGITTHIDCRSGISNCSEGQIRTYRATQGI